MSQTRTKTACVAMSGSDERMDENKREPLNRLPIKCPHCTFPDLDFVATPYLLGKGICAPAEIDSALLGNLLVRGRVRRILEVAVPGACTFHPTADAKSRKPAPWWLVVPRHQLRTALPEPTPPLCPKCHESKDGHWERGGGWPVVWKKMASFDPGGIDVFKSTGWVCGGTAEDLFEQRNFYRSGLGEEPPPIPWSHMFPGVEPPTHAERWTRCNLDRELYFSVRLEQLLKRAKVKGRLYQLGFDDVLPSPEDEVWIHEKLGLLEEHGLVGAPKPVAKSGSARRWFTQFLNRNTAKRLKPVDFATVEKKHKLALPQDYKDFIAQVGPKSFENVNGLEVTETTICLPKELDFRNYRRGKDPRLVGEDADVDGVVFAFADFGDCYLFDVSVPGGDYPVYWYKHEESLLEPYAPNFAECIKRFAQRN
jgi:hypothetical protein